MQTIYIYTMLGYEIAYSYKQGIHLDRKHHLPESEQKIAIALIGFTMAKLVFTYIFSKVLSKLPNALNLYITGAVCAITLFVHTLIGSLSSTKYTNAWFFGALLWGIQDAFLSGKVEIDVVNPITEVSEDNIDISILARIIGIVIIGFVGSVTRKAKSYGLMIVLIVVFVASFLMTFLGTFKGGESSASDKLMIDAKGSSKEEEGNKEGKND